MTIGYKKEQASEFLCILSMVLALDRKHAHYSRSEDGAAKGSSTMDRVSASTPSALNNSLAGDIQQWDLSHVLKYYAPSLLKRQAL